MATSSSSSSEIEAETFVEAVGGLQPCLHDPPKSKNAVTYTY